MTIYVNSCSNIIKKERISEIELPHLKIKMLDKTVGDQTRYEGRGSNSGRGFGIGRVNSYGIGRGHGFNSTKPKVRRKCEALGKRRIFDRRCTKIGQVNQNFGSYTQLHPRLFQRNKLCERGVITVK